MTEQLERKRVLITVMTYPLPSQAHLELVCTAGVADTGEWVRLYPIDYRYMPRDKQFKKYQWVEVDLSPVGHGNDNRKESRRPDLKSMSLIGEPISTRDNWRDRRDIIDHLPHCTLNQLQAQHDIDKTSLGIVRPSKVLDIKITPDGEKWKPEWEALFKETRMFGEQKPLRKIPYKFQYVFKCEDSEKPHNAMIEDWELGALFLNESDRLGSDEAAAESVKNKFLNEICGEGKDTRFFMGTTFPFNTWVVVGTFWPNKEDPGLFEIA